MIQIVAHRGFWSKKTTQNTTSSLKAALDRGFGIETDIRDYKGKLVISHDPPFRQPVFLEELLKYYFLRKLNSTLALNVKANGLQELSLSLIDRYRIKHYFFFDSSVPDALGYLKRDLTYFTRLSDLERTPHLLKESDGLWMDELKGPWLSSRIMKKWFIQVKKACIVSPELHGRPHLTLWKQLRTLLCADPKLNKKILLCTDYPRQAQEFFK